jgi:myo-inositol-1(or 4)-monophosphatase
MPRRQRNTGCRQTGPVTEAADLLELATGFAREAGALALRMQKGVRTLDPKSSPTDVVTAADKAVERRLTELIRAARPGDGLLGEEGASDEGTTGLRWVVDPIDGTVNYLYGIPQWAVSIGVGTSAAQWRASCSTPQKTSSGRRFAVGGRRSTAQRSAARR